MANNSRCFDCIHAYQSLHYYYEHMCEKFDYVETDGRASSVVEVLLSTLGRYVMLKQTMGIDDLELAFYDVMEELPDMTPRRIEEHCNSGEQGVNGERTTTH